MRVTAAIFLSIISALTVQPLLSSQKVVGEQQCCAKDMCSKSHKEPKRNCNDKPCNPFLACAYGNFYINEPLFTATLSNTILRDKHILENDNRLSTTLSDLWKPPKSVMVVQ